MTDVGKDARSESKPLAIEADWVSEISKCKTEGQRKNHFGNSGMVMGKEGCIKKKGKNFHHAKDHVNHSLPFTLLELMELKDGGRADKWRGAYNTECYGNIGGGNMGGLREGNKEVAL